jgi:hypothetical protein
MQRHPREIAGATREMPPPKSIHAAFTTRLF